MDSRTRVIKGDNQKWVQQLGAVLERLGAVLEWSCGVLGPSWGVLGPSWGVLGPSWGDLGAPWGGLVVILGRLGAHVFDFEGIWDHLGTQNRPRKDSKTHFKIDRIYDPRFEQFWTSKWSEKRPQS